jgi:hypothetical protein
VGLAAEVGEAYEHELAGLEPEPVAVAGQDDLDRVLGQSVHIGDPVAVAADQQPAQQ